MKNPSHSSNPLFNELKGLCQHDETVFEFFESSAVDGVWFWDLENPEQEWMSKSFWTTLGYDPAGKKHLASEWQSIINQDDLKTAKQNFEKHCADPSHPYDQIVRYQHSSGKTVWIRCRGIAIRDKNGKPVRMLGTHTDISSLKEHELKSIEKEKQQRIAFEKQAMVLDELEKTANIGTWEMNLESGDITWSPQTKKIHDVPDDYEPNLSSGINFYKEGESRRLITEAVERGINEGKPWALELQLITAMGREIWVRALGKPLFDNGKCIRLFGVFQDISHQKAVEEQLRSARQHAVQNSLRLQLAHDGMGMGVWEWDLATNELLWDDWMYSLYGIDEFQFSGAYDAWVNSVHPDDINHAQMLLQKAITDTGKYDTEFRIVLPDGQIRHVKANAAVVKDETGNPTKVIGVNYDVSEKVHTMAVLEQEKQKAEAATEAKSDFLANMSHEIRTPMNAILGGLQLLGNADLNDKYKSILQNAAFSAQSLLTIINDILDYSKIESNKLELELAPFTLKEVVESVQYDLQPLISSKGIELNVHIEKQFKDGWMGDIVRVKQVLLNIASNAVKFTHEGSVDIRILTGQYDNKDAILIEVKDTGIGMSDEVCKRIFDRFTQADTSTTRKFGGTGLGMSITLNLVRLMGGELTIDSEVNSGTQVNVALPLASTNLTTVTEQNGALTVPNLLGREILVAEDNEINQAVIEAFLAETQANVTLVDNGAKAVEAVKNTSFDIIFMDIHMPVMDGREAQHRIASLDEHIPVVALTANVMPADVEDYLKRGFVYHIGKPIDAKKLYDVLENQLGVHA